MIAEIVAALVVGVFALALVVEPLLRARRPVQSILDLPELEETPRGIALAALREIEFDKVTGKLSDTDYAMLKEQYTRIALEAIRAEEQSAAGSRVTTAGNPAPDAVEAIIAAKVRALRSAKPSPGGTTASCPSCGPRPEADAVFCSTCGKRLPTGVACAGCGAALPDDSSFCEACGYKRSA